MSIWYVKKMDNKVNLIKKCLKIITLTQVQNHIIVQLPVEKNKDISNKLQKKLAERIAKKMYDKPNQNLVLACNLEPETFKNTLFANNCNILNGRWLFKYLMPHIVDYVAEKQGRETQKLEVAIMTNNNNENNLKIIIEIAKKVKMLKVITNDIDKFKRVEEYLFENLGIVIRTTNNRKKGLLRSDLILNVDFNEEILNQYSIPKNAIVVNISERISIKSRRFEGINSNYYSITLPEEYKNWFKDNNLLNGFDESILLESMLYSKKSYDAIEAELQNVKIEYLIGNNGRIRNEEYLIAT